MSQISFIIIIFFFCFSLPKTIDVLIMFCFNASNPNIVMKLRNHLIRLDCSYEECKIILKAVPGRESLCGLRILAGLLKHRYGPRTTVYGPSTGLNS